MKRFRLRVLFTVLLAVCFVVVFSWIVAWQNYRLLSSEASKERPLYWEAVRYTLDNLSKSWNDYEKRVINRYEVEAVFASLALKNVIDDDDVPEEDQENGFVVRIQDDEISSDAPEVRILGLDASLFKNRRGSFAAPDRPSTFVTYSRIGNTSGYFVKLYEDTVLTDVMREAVDIPGILQWTEITYGLPAMFVSCDPDSGEISEILYKNNRYLSNCESIEELGLTKEDLKMKEGAPSGTLFFDDVSFSYVSGESALPAGYVILLEPMPNLYAKAFVQEGYMIAALIILMATLLVTGFSLYQYILNNILTPEAEKVYQPSHVRSVMSLFGVLGLVVIAFFGMFSYALNGVYDEVVRGREHLGMMSDSLSMNTERYNRNIQSFRDVYLDYGNLIAEFLDTYPELRDSAVLSTLADSISASSITLYDSNGRETVSSGRWNGLKLGTEPESSTYDFRRILRGVPSIIHDPETDELTGLNEMRLGIQIRDDSRDDRYGVMMLCVDLSSPTTHDIDPEKSARQIFANLSDSETTFWVADAKTGSVLVSSTQDMEGENITGLGLLESDLKGSLMKTLMTEEGDFFVTSISMETPGILEWTKAAGGVIIYCRRPETSRLIGMCLLAVTGGILFLVIYGILARLILSGYTDDFFNRYKHIKGADDPKKNLKPFRRRLAAVTPVRKGTVTMEIFTAVFLLQMIPIVNSNAFDARNTVYRYVYAGEWEKGLNLFAIAAIVILLSKIVLFVIALRLLMSICASFSGPKAKTVFRLFSSVILYVALIFFMIKAFEYLGFSPEAIAAGMGSLALAVSLGSQNFVSDIFAGLTYVFEGTIHVGDNVEISAQGSSVSSGKVVEVGVRSVKLLTREGDFVTYSNRDIKSIKNRTQMNTRVICELVISSGVSAQELEQMLKTEIPGIGKTDGRIVNGPVYNGITALGNGTMTLSVSAECRDEDYFYVRDKLNVSLQRIFREHGYSI